MHLPVILDSTTTRPIDPIDRGAAASGEGRRQAPAAFVFRGELLDEAAERSYRPRPNLQISEVNRRAIETYRGVDAEPAPLGRILDGYI